MNRRSFFSIAAAVRALRAWWSRRKIERVHLGQRYRKLSREEIRAFAPVVDWPEWFASLYVDRKTPGCYVVAWPGTKTVTWMKWHLARDPAFCLQHMTFASLRAEADRRAELIGF